MPHGDELGRLVALQEGLSAFADHVIGGTELYAVSWSEATLRVRAVGGHVEQDRLVIQNGRGAQVTSSLDVEDLDPRVAALRDLYYTEDVGTWFGLDLTLARDEHGAVGVSADLTYDEDPGFHAAHSHDFVADQERYPRSPDHVPAWVQAQLDRAPHDQPPPARRTGTPERQGFWRRLRRRD